MILILFGVTKPSNFEPLPLKANSNLTNSIFKNICTVLFILICSISFSQDGRIDTIVGKDGIKYLNKTIEYPGGLKGLYNDIGAKFILPKKAKQDNVHGKILLEFTVDTLGLVTSPKIIEGLRKDVDEAVIQMSKKLKRFKPALINDKKVPQRMNIPMTL